MILAFGKALHESSNNLFKQFSLVLIHICEFLGYLHFLEINKRQNGSKYVVPDRALITHLKVLNMANLLDRSVILFNLPVLVMESFEIVLCKIGFFRQVHNVVAMLVL